MKNTYPAWAPTLFVITLLLIAAVISGCNDDGQYCYKGHDLTYIGIDGAHHVESVCEDWRDTHFKYDNQQGASNVVPK